ncbi:hypothetical protein PFICI_12610 [Pestalotiopsis fici W106-1]|uniref:Proteophosphoglycan 5 n=1 Tax=Pestalotiopsis fici (strain W106-1 / CGMCC3.15140) TaxID=1229662 RepID=W3WS57_PESFW|nr:uncharacterized protein PFICI_12610 [Pestalotiopsis fici W106-1]ETS75666.1 hypothetical protein PFICI_12610 [Pestalotiopsis fici W106-1]
MNQSPHPKNSARRRGARNGTPQKTYASENDAANYRYPLSDSPYTPQRLPSNGTPVNHQQQQQAQSATQKKPRNRNPSAKKNKDHQDRHSPNQQQAIPLAFAGASFHASPAPNSLPIPSFLARTTSAPDSPSLKLPGPGPSQEPSPPNTDSEENSSPSPPLHAAVRTDESPLEFFFKADRAEKARVRRASSANAAAALLGSPFSPPQVHASPREPSTFPKLQGAAQARRPPIPRNPSSGIPSSELDGNPGKPLGQAFSTPYSERIKAARSRNASGQGTPSAQGPDTPDRSEALKRFLGVGSPATQIHPSYGHPQSPSHHVAPPAFQPGMSPASGPNRHYSNAYSSGPHPSALGPIDFSANHVRGGQPNQETLPTDNYADQALKLDDHLRRVLKLGPN